MAASLVGTPVAKTIGVGIINPGIVDDYLILSALGGAIIWNIVTWYFGLPSSSSHALIGGLIGTGIVKTMGTKITKLRPMGGFASETAAAIAIIGASFGEIPVSTTHTITGAIVGVGATIRMTAVRWGVAGNIIWAWILTVPISAIISGLIYALITFFK